MAQFPRSGYIPLSYHQVMLNDRVRTEGFQRAIAYAVHPGDVVLEVGGGTGVLSFFAARRARKVYTVEYSVENAEACRRFAALNGLSDKVEVVCADAREFVPPERVDAVVCEMMHVAMVNEQQVGVLNAVLRQLRARQSKMPRMIPFAAINACQLVHYDFSHYGMDFPFPRFVHPSRGDERLVEVSEPVIYWKLDFHQENPTDIDERLEFRATADGQVNALRFVTRTLLDDRLAGANDWYLNHMVVPLSEPVSLKAGEQLAVHLAYEAGCEIDAMRVTVAPSAIRV